MNRKKQASLVKNVLVRLMKVDERGLGMLSNAYNLNHLVVHIHFILDKITYPGWEDIRNLVNVHSFYWVHEGEGTFLTNTEHQVQAGMLAYLKPGLEMSMRSRPEAPLRMTMELARAVRLINNRPRKCLNWKSAYEAFMDELSQLA